MDTNNSSASPRIITNQQGTIAPTQSQYVTDALANVLDRDWLQNAFMVPDSGFTLNTEGPLGNDVANRYYSTANMKFTDTRLGGSIGINPRPQFCHYSDVPVPGRLARNTPSLEDVSGNYGMGRQYSEMIDDAAQRIYMTFGVPQFNSLFQFFSSAYETTQVTLARTGRAQSFFYQAGNFVGRGALIRAFPLTSIAIYVGGLASYFISRPKSKFYSMKQTMVMYWSTVNQLVQAMTVNRGIMPKFLSSEQQQREGTAFMLDQTYLQALANYMPDIFRYTGIAGFQFDIFSVITRAQRQANAQFKQEYNMFNSGTFDFTGYVRQVMTGNHGKSTPFTDDEGNLRVGAKVDQETTVLLEDLFTAMGNIAAGLGSFLLDGANPVGMEVDPRSDTVATDPNSPNTQINPNGNTASFGQSLIDNVEALIHDGGLFATFIVDSTGPMSESWSNAVTESELAQQLNGKVSDMAEARFGAMEGNIIGGIAGAAVGAVANAVTDSASGILNGITFGLSATVQGLAGAGYIDIPKHWQSSSFQATRANYSMELITPYGNPISQLMALDIPMAMIMAGALPRSTGKASYTAPFLCQIFDRGRCQIRLGMIETLSFTRGTSHLGFSDRGNAMKIDVNFTVVDLSSIMHMPISTGKIFESDMTMDDDNILQDYLAVLGGQSVENQIYFYPQIKIKIAKFLMNASKLTSPAYYAAVFGDSIVGDITRIFTRQTSETDYTGSGV